jgi:hypothetical protein
MSNRVMRFETPFLARVRQLAPETIHDLIRHRGLDACGDLVAAATPEQLTSVLDLDLWSPPRPGLDERFDAARFGEWVEALIDAGETVATRTIAALDANLVIAGLSRHILVFDAASFEPTAASDDEAIYDRRRRDSEREVCGYVLRARRGEAWDAIVTLLLALDGEHADVLHTLLQGCRRLSNSPPEIDGLDDLLALPEQQLHEVAIEREDRRSAQGYVTPGDARAFLQMARQPATTRAPHTMPGGPAIVRHDAERATHLERGQELAFLANTLMAGCAIQSRPFTAREASEAAAAICTLGLEHWPARWPAVDTHEATASGTLLPSTLVVDRDLVTAFRVGWSVLHEDVSLYVADRLIATLADLRVVDVEIQRGLDDLGRALVRHRGAGTPWRAHGALEVLTLLDIPAWAAVAGVLDECPVLPAALGAILGGGTTTISATEFAFFSTVDQIRQVRAFMDRLPGLLLG